MYDADEESSGDEGVRERDEKNKKKLRLGTPHSLELG